MRGDYKNIFNIKDNIKKSIKSKLNQINNKFDTSSYFETDTTYRKRFHKHSYSLYDKLKKINQKNNDNENNILNIEKNKVEIGAFTHREFNGGKKIDLNILHLPKVLSSRNVNRNKIFNKNFSKVNDCYLDSQTINLSPTNDLLYKTNCQIYLEKLEKDKNIKNKIPLKTIQIVNSSIYSTLNSFKKNSDNKNQYSSFNIQNNNFSPSTTFTNYNKEEIKEFNFNDVLNNIFRIIKVYNQRNDYIKEDKVISMIQSEMSDYYKIKRNKD